MHTSPIFFQGVSVTALRQVFSELRVYDRPAAGPSGDIPKGSDGHLLTYVAGRWYGSRWVMLYGGLNATFRSLRSKCTEGYVSCIKVGSGPADSGIENCLWANDRYKEQVCACKVSAVMFEADIQRVMDDYAQNHGLERRSIPV